MPNNYTYREFSKIYNMVYNINFGEEMEQRYGGDTQKKADVTGDYVRGIIEDDIRKAIQYRDRLKKINEHYFQDDFSQVYRDNVEQLKELQRHYNKNGQKKLLENLKTDERMDEMKKPEVQKLFIFKGCLEDAKIGVKQLQYLAQLKKENEFISEYEKKKKVQLGKEKAFIRKYPGFDAEALKNEYAALKKKQEELYKLIEEQKKHPEKKEQIKKEYREPELGSVNDRMNKIAKELSEAKELFKYRTEFNEQHIKVPEKNTQDYHAIVADDLGKRAKDLLEMNYNTGSHKDSKEYTEMIKQLTYIAEATTARQREDGLVLLTKAARNYLVEKNKQIRPFASTLRSTRLAFAESLLNFSSKGTDMLLAVSPERMKDAQKRLDNISAEIAERKPFSEDEYYKELKELAAQKKSVEKKGAENKASQPKAAVNTKAEETKEQEGKTEEIDGPQTGV